MKARRRIATLARQRSEPHVLVIERAWFVAGTGGFEAATGWKPRMDKRDGVGALTHWLREHRVMAGGQLWVREAIS